MLQHIGSLEGGKKLLSDFLVKGDTAVSFAVADQWTNTQPIIALQFLERLAHDTSRPLMAFAAGVKYRQRRLSLPES